MTTYKVSHWTTHPLLGNEDCLDEWEFDELKDALSLFRASTDPRVGWIALDGPVVKFRSNPGHSCTPTDSEWRREAVQQAGMAHGTVGANNYG